MGSTARVASVRPRAASSRVKRAVDIAGSLLLLVVLSPLITGVASIVRIRLGRPVFFRQSRPGLGERPFILVKFRTMTDSRDSSGRLLPDERRLTGLGRLLRSTSLDELPELLNVLRGEMSLVGPRPLLVEYLALYSRRQARRHEVHPGLTGLAQVSGRNLLSWPQKLEADVSYIENWSLWLDVTIIWKTIGQVLGRRGITPRDLMSVPPFRGEARDE